MRNDIQQHLFLCFSYVKITVIQVTGHFKAATDESTKGGRWKLYENRVLLCPGCFEPGI